MSSATPQPHVPPPTKREILIVSHSTLYYWWPVWAVGFLMAIITAFTGDRVALVPNNVDLFKQASGSLTVEQTKTGAASKEKTITTFEFSKQDVLVAPKPASEKHAALPIALTPVHVSTNKNLGVLYTLVLLVVIFITNVPLRGLWSVIVIILLVALVVILGLLGVLDDILLVLSFLDIRITTGGYVVFSSVLFVLWLVVFLLFDRQIYMIFTPGQLRVKLEIGDAETVYDTTGLMLQKQRSDLFRHWILGLGSGDLIVHVARAAGEHGQDIPMANVLFVGRKVHEIEKLLRERQVVAGPSS